nr:MAG TPA: hypothetical protein [Caudoviricetes sp.]
MSERGRADDPTNRIGHVFQRLRHRPSGTNCWRKSRTPWTCSTRRTVNYGGKTRNWNTN